jgi:hypothetical protein
MDNNFIKVHLLYCVKGGQPSQLTIAPDTYFDRLEEGEILTYDSTPKYLEQFRYTGEQFESLSWSKLTIHEEISSASMVSEERYWGENNCYRLLIVSLYKNGDRISWEGTIEIACQGGGELHVLKIKEPTVECISGLVSHTIISGVGDNETVIPVQL